MTTVRNATARIRRAAGWYANTLVAGGLSAVAVGVMLVFGGDSGALTGVFLGLAVSVPATVFYREFALPRLVIGDVSIHPIVFDDHPAGFYCLRLDIFNVGRSAADGCKAYVAVPRRVLIRREGFLGDLSDSIRPIVSLRLPWTTSAERPAATINAGDIESLDLIAVWSDSSDIDYPAVIGYEDGWKVGPPTTCRLLHHIPRHVFVTVTGRNARGLAVSVDLRLALPEQLADHLVFTSDDGLKELAARHAPLRSQQARGIEA